MSKLNGVGGGGVEGVRSDIWLMDLCTVGLVY